MDEILNDVEVRVLGALIEKEITTPDYYPLSLHSLVTACNQSSNRHPVVSYDEAMVSAAIDRLRRGSLVRGIQRSDSRVTKYQHLLIDAMALSPRELGVMCVLMLRGPQTVGEIKTRTARLAEFEGLPDVEATLEALIGRQPALAVRLPRQTGQKELRYAHLLSGEPTVDAPSGRDAAPAPTAQLDTERLITLEAAMTEIQNEMSDLRRQFGDFRKQFE